MIRVLEMDVLMDAKLLRQLHYVLATPVIGGDQMEKAASMQASTLG